MQIILRNLILTALFSMACICAQVQVIPQVADGGGWRSTLVLTNTSSSPENVTLLFYKDTTSGATDTWTPPFLEGLPTSINGGSSVFLHTSGTAAAVSQGWAQLIGSPDVVAYVIYTFTSNGRSQDATAPALSTATRILVPFDNTTPAGSAKGLTTALAVVNPNPISLTISVNLKTSGPGGSATQGTALNLPANGQMAFVMPSQFPATAGLSGLAEFYSNSLGFSIIALRGNPTGGLTSLQVYFESGAPIITTTGGGGGGGGGGVPAGDITFAGFSIGKTTSSVGGTESVGGLIAAYKPTAWNLPFNGTKIDKCVVFDVSYSGANYPSAPELSLDAGQITLTGPGLAGGSVVVPEINTTGSIGPIYSKMLPSGTLAGGGKYTLTAAGGTQVEGFSASATLPNNFTTNVNTISSIDRTKPLPINWTGTGFENVIIGVNGTAISGTTVHAVVISCLVATQLGTYSIPAAALSKLPAISGPLSGIGSLSVSTAPAITGTVSGQSSTETSLTPNLVGGGKTTYGGFAPHFSVQQSVTIQ